MSEGKLLETFASPPQKAASFPVDQIVAKIVQLSAGS